MAKNEELIAKLKSQGLLDRIPSHEIEEILGIYTDDFDYRKRRHGYPYSQYYKDFYGEQAGVEKIITNRLLQADLNERFIFFKIRYPKKYLISIIFFSILCILSFFAWLFFVDNGNLLGSFYSFFSSIISASIVWFALKYKFSDKNPREYYEQTRKKDYTRDIPMLPILNNSFVKSV